MCDLIYLQVLPPGAKYYKNDSNYKLQIAQKEKKRTKHSERESERESRRGKRKKTTNMTGFCDMLEERRIQPRR